METSSKANANKGYYSYPSTQRRQGPAPLASFEDLPPDDQQSISELENDFHDFSPEEDAIRKALEVDSKSLISDTHTITPTSIKSPDIIFTTSASPNDVSSEHTATPVGIQVTSPGSGRDETLGERLTPKTPLEGDKRGSAGSLQVPRSGYAASETESNTPSPDPKRKGSWTNIFFRGRSNSKSPSRIESPQKSPVSEEPNKKKKGFLSFFKPGRKSPDGREPLPPPSHDQPNHSETSFTSGEHSTPRVSIADSEIHEELMYKQSDEPQESQQDIIEIVQSQALEKNNGATAQELSGTIPAPNLARRKLQKRSDTMDDDVQSLPEILPSDRKKGKDLCKPKESVSTVATIEHQNSEEHYNSSESELEESKATDKKDYCSKSSEAADDDYEAANLLTQDSVDYDDISSGDFHCKNPPVSVMHMQLKARKQRLEVTTIPVERPRSTTPINIAPLEAFIKSATTSPDPNVEKIKLSLPGDQFTASARSKSPRKSNPQIWLDFCEKGLHSPKTARKNRNSLTGAFTNLPLSTSVHDAFTPVTDASSRVMSPLTPVTPLDEEDKWTFGDNFDPISFLNGQQGKMVIECNNCDCMLKKTVFEVEETGGDDTPSDEKRTLTEGDEISVEERQPLVSPNPCSCDCHKRVAFANSLWKNASLQKQDRVLSASSDISSASSRLIGSSSSSKCSLAEEADEVCS